MQVEVRFFAFLTGTCIEHGEFRRSYGPRKAAYTHASHKYA